jgi:hypothetical protein
MYNTNLVAVYLFVLGLFNFAVSSDCEHIASNGVNSGQLFGKDVEVQFWHFLGETEENMKNLALDTRCLG